MVAPSRCPAVLKATRQQNLGATAGHELQCREIALSVGLVNMEGPQLGSYGPPVAVSSAAEPKPMLAF